MNSSQQKARHLFLLLAVGLSVSFCASNQPSRFSDSAPPNPAVTSAERPSRKTLEPPAPSFLGVSVNPYADAQGISIVDVVPGSPAYAAGLRQGDVVLLMNSQPLPSPEQFIDGIRREGVGKTLSFRVNSKGQIREIQVTLAAMPDPSELQRMRFVGRPAPPLTGLSLLSNPDGEHSPTLGKKILVLEFWSPYCIACRRLHQRMNEWQEQWKGYPVTILGIAPLPLDVTRAKAQELALSYPQASDPEELAFRGYDILAVPSLFLIDRNGIVVDAMTGYVPDRLLQMEHLLGNLVNRQNLP